MKLIYPARFHAENGTYWVEFPDLLGCQSFGDTIAETLANAQEALEGYAMTVLEDGKLLNKPSDIKSFECGEGEFMSLVDCNLTYSMSKNKAVKKTLTIPKWLNDRAVEKGVNFSGVLQNALMEQIDIQN